MPDLTGFPIQIGHIFAKKSTPEERFAWSCGKTCQVFSTQMKHTQLKN